MGRSCTPSLVREPRPEMARHKATTSRLFMRKGTRLRPTVIDGRRPSMAMRSDGSQLSAARRPTEPRGRSPGRGLELCGKLNRCRHFVGKPAAV